MAEQNTKRLKPSFVQDDINSYSALEAMTGYAPANAAFSAANVLASRNAMTALKADEVQAVAAAKAARDAATAAEWAFHDMILGVKRQVEAQYGESSDELQAIGLKKKSEYKKPGAKKPPTP